MREVFTGADEAFQDGEFLAGPRATEILIAGAAPLECRKSLTLQNNGPNDVKVGGAGISSTTGFTIPANGGSASFDFGPHIRLWAVCAVQQVAGAGLWVIEAS